ncbi:MAG TPA: hypothetical protein VGF31_09055 [Myxococcaceae bacterium]|jgi:hypothetical protein
MANLIAHGCSFQLHPSEDAPGLRNNMKARMQPGVQDPVLDVLLANRTVLHLNCAQLPYAVVVDQPPAGPVISSFSTSPTI